MRKGMSRVIPRGRARAVVAALRARVPYGKGSHEGRGKGYYGRGEHKGTFGTGKGKSRGPDGSPEDVYGGGPVSDRDRACWLFSKVGVLPFMSWVALETHHSK